MFCLRFCNDCFIQVDEHMIIGMTSLAFTLLKLYLRDARVVCMAEQGYMHFLHPNLQSRRLNPERELNRMRIQGREGLRWKVDRCFYNRTCLGFLVEQGS